jgi:hypothetical protein
VPRTRCLKRFSVVLAALVCVLVPSVAHAAVFEEPAGAAYEPSKPAVLKNLGTYREPIQVYGRISAPGEIDVYRITAGADSNVSIRISVPVWPSTGPFRPAALLIPASAAVGRQAAALPDLIGQGTEVIDPGLETRQAFRDSISTARYYQGGSTGVSLKRGQSYAIAVFDVTGQAGPYRLTIGEDRSGPFAGLAHPLRLIRLKFGAYGGAGPDTGVLIVFWAELLMAAILLGGAYYVIKMQLDERSANKPRAED